MGKGTLPKESGFRLRLCPGWSGAKSLFHPVADAAGEKLVVQLDLIFVDFFSAKPSRKWLLLQHGPSLVLWTHVKDPVLVMAICLWPKLNFNRFLHEGQ